MFRKTRDNLWGVLAFVGLVWVVFAVSFIVDMKPLALQPRSAQGLIGILLMPFLHQDLNHLLGNTVPLTVLLFMLRATRRTPWRILVSLIVGAGVLLWALGRPERHMGCSVLIYSLAAYLISAGVYERKPLPIAAAVLVTVLYGTLFWGLLPTAGSSVSWEGHLFGALFGAVYAHQTLQRRDSQSGRRLAKTQADADSVEHSGASGPASQTSSAPQSLSSQQSGDLDSNASKSVEN